MPPGGKEWLTRRQEGGKTKSGGIIRRRGGGEAEYPQNNGGGKRGFARKGKKDRSFTAQASEKKRPNSVCR